MSKIEIKKRILYLIQYLNDLNYKYYILNDQTVSDSEYDKYYDELKKLEDENNIKFSHSPTCNVGPSSSIKLSSLDKVNHEYKLLSLEKKHTIDEIKKWLGDKQAIISLKFDGLTLSLKYSNNNFVQAATRGDGYIGEDVSHTAKNAINIIQTLTNHDIDDDIFIRGEAIITYSEFEKINNNLPHNKDKFKSPRNLASGTLRNYDSNITYERNVVFIPFDLKTENSSFKRYSEILDFLNKQGFRNIYYWIIHKDNVETVINEIKSIIPKLDYPIDGLVIRYNDLQYGESLGQTSKTPKDSISFKFEDEDKKTIFRGIEWRVSRTGRINPVGYFDPVTIDNTTVENASIHNLSILKNLKLGIGDEILVYKANCIIPQIRENYTKSNNIEIPDKCPCCGKETKIVKDNESEFLKCQNSQCNSILISSFSHIVSKKAFNIEFISEATLELFVQYKILTSLFDIVDVEYIQSKKNEILGLPGFKEKKFNKLIQSIQHSLNNIKLENFIYSLSIPSIGFENSRAIARFVNYDFDKLLNICDNKNEYELLQIEDIGEIKAKNILKKFNDHRQKIIKLRSYFNFADKPIQNNSNILNDMVICATGDLSLFETKNKLKQIVESNGGKMTNSVSSKTSILINNDINSNSEKNKKATELNIPILSEKDFHQKYLKD